MNLQALIQNFIDISLVFVEWARAAMVPSSLNTITLVHIAIWVPVFGALVVTNGSLVRRAARTTARVAEQTNKPKAKIAAQKQRQQVKQARRVLTAAHELTATRKQATAEKAAQTAERRRLVEERKQAREVVAQERTERKQAREQAAAEKAAQTAERRRLAEERKQAREVVAQERTDRKQAREQAAAERRANQEQKPPRRTRKQNTASPITKAFGADPNTIYNFRYRVVDLDQLITSNTDSGAINPDYNQALQPRLRDRVASQQQIDTVARSIVPESLLWDFHALDKGAPIIGDDLMVESGNGRLLALRRARTAYPEQFSKYQEGLRANLADRGINAAALDGVAAPVLVRERLDDVDRAAFAREANAPPVLQMSTLETAIADSARISDRSVLGLTVRDDQSIDQALRAKSNSQFVRDFADTLSDNERAVLMRRDGTLAQMGIWRIKAAVFTRVFPGESGRRLAETFLESLDSNIKNYESAISGTLPALARSQSLIASGQRSAELDIIGDTSQALDMLARLREQDMTPRVFVEQSSLFERELTPQQERLLLHFDTIGRSQKNIREFFNNYANAIEDAPVVGQSDLFGPTEYTKDQLLDKLIEQQRTKPERKAA